MFPIRVAQVMGKMMGGGVEQFVLNYYRRIDKNKIQFDFIVDKDSKIVPRTEIEKMGGRVFYVSSYRNILKYSNDLSRLFKKYNWKIVHSHLNSLSVFPLCIAKQCGVPIRIAHSHSMSGKGELLKNTFKYVLKKFANKYPTNRFACSASAGKWLFGNNVEFDVVYNAIDIGNYIFNRNIRQLMRKKYNIKDNCVVIGNVGRNVKQKNQIYLLNIIEKIIHINNNVLLVIIGNGKLHDKLKKVVASKKISNYVKFIDHSNSVFDYYQMFDIFCLPSLYEGLGMVAIEAQCSGLPCLLSDNVPREVNVTSNVKFLPLRNEDVWINEILKINPRHRLDVNIEMLEKYDINNACFKLEEKYLNLYKRITND